ncbi:flagellar biosynthetic protein FliQ [Albimonas pacifica]|uniref:Flagellar biosynthetic protein FliQ n=1 Tax=Albimonas pacifica TaxID=1114924 RepID=A0A1I3DZL7_9RHOB|nr:flagellar biosynthetic protein FliQ [Albimonas pacifica]SFH92135.1 flagellar biosynthetic protein FliQ [Albimonas pacifica]
MDDATLYDMMRQGLWAAIIASLPILTVALATGLAIGLVQALTSIQELTLTFVPKLAAIAGTFWIAMEFMGAAFLDLWRDVLVPLIAQGG